MRVCSLIPAILGLQWVSPCHLPETKTKARLVSIRNECRIFFFFYLRTIETFIFRDPNCICFIPRITVMHGVQRMLHLCVYSFLPPSLPPSPPSLSSFPFFVDFIYNYFREGQSRDRGISRFPAEQGAWCGAQSQDPKTVTRAECRCLTKCQVSHLGAPSSPPTPLVTWVLRCSV